MGYNLVSFLKGLLIQNEVDKTKKLAILVSPSSTTNTTTTVTATQTANRDISLPDASDTLVGRATTDTLTNKTIDGDNNTITDISSSSFKPVLADANNFLVRDGSGNVVSNTKAVPSGTVVGTSDSQTLTNKVITVGTANRALQTDGSGNVAASSVTSTELGYVSGVTSALQSQIDGKQPLDADLTALAGLSATGLIARTGSGTAAARTLTAGSNKLSISNGDGVAGNPTADVAEANLTLNNIGGTLGINKGGTGQTTANTALNALLPSQTGNATKVLQTDGTNTSWAAGAALTNPMTTLGDIIVGGASGVPARLPIGTDGQALIYDSASTDLIKWGSPRRVIQPSPIITANYSVTNDDDILLCNSSVNSTFTITLPTAVGIKGKIYRIIKNTFVDGADNITLTTTSSQTIKFQNHAQTSVALITVGESWEVISDGSNWAVLQHDTVTNPSTYTPTFTGFGTPTNVFFKWHRRFDKILVEGFFTSGTPTATAGSITLPSGFTIDTTDYPSTSLRFSDGSYYVMQSGNFGSSSLFGVMAVDTANTGQMYFSGSGSSNQFDKRNGNAVTNGTNGIYVEFEVPIVSWNA